MSPAADRVSGWPSPSGCAKTAIGWPPSTSNRQRLNLPSPPMSRTAHRSMPRSRRSAASGAGHDSGQRRGLDGFKRFVHITFDEWQRIIDVNLNGVFHTIQAVLPDMLEAGWGRIVNISSSSTHSGVPYMSHYVAAKSAVNGLTKSLALEYGPAASRSTRCRPVSSTPDAAQGRGAGPSRRHREKHRRDPVRRIGKPEDIAAACAFLVSEEAGYITGQILGVNGGRNT
ncbi:short chain dehydrogenase family protein [Mycobacterium xenopi 4042]|uniref:3-oxoacyl-[acyl-carrier-protein] reductase MabA n=1 Tax=Mycobacterium xenopi 4042 TaxID=1299334 RepID=X8AGT3_MYCXE|nr:short chain dehydrogenase family protein [Mycobacterium xenopi 4042]